MDYKLVCQSCNMPIDKNELRGTEKDGSLSTEYCIYCYQNGAFINPDISLDEMKILVKGIMEKMNMDPGLVNMTVSSLLNLKRWRAPMR